MATKKFIIEVEEGFTICPKCPMSGIGCQYIDCHKYNLATMKIKEYDGKTVN